MGGFAAAAPAAVGELELFEAVSSFSVPEAAGIAALTPAADTAVSQGMLDYLAGANTPAAEAVAAANAGYVPASTAAQNAAIANAGGTPVSDAYQQILKAFQTAPAAGTYGPGVQLAGPMVPGALPAAGAGAGAGAGAASVPWQGGVWQGSLGNAAATPFSLSANPLLNPAAAGDLLTTGVTSGMPIGAEAVATFPQSATMAEIMAPGTTYTSAAGAAPGMFDKLSTWYDSLSGLQKMGLGLGASMAAQSLFGKDKEGPAAAEKYSGPLSKFKYDPGKYTPLTTAQPTPYRPAYHAYAAGGPVEQMSNQNAIGANTGFPMADINHAAYATPYQQPIPQNVLMGAQDTRVDPYTGQERFAAGGQTDTSGFTRALRGSPGVLGGLAGLVGRNQGMAAPAPTTYGFSPALQMFQNLQAQRAAAPQMPSRPAPIETYADYANQMAANRAALARPAPAPVQLNPAAFSKYNQPVDTGSPYPGGVAQYESGGSYAHGGIASLGAYSDGGRMLKGPGDGMSDNIPATIAGKQPARLANEEFVVPADVVSHLGNGSSDAGAKQLYKMMDKVRQARTGTKKQGKQINPDKYLPA